MKTSIFKSGLLAGLLASSLLGSAAQAAPVVFVPDASSGWVTTNYTFASNFVGTITIGVSNEDDFIVHPELLVDNISGVTTTSPLTENLGFESGDLTGFSTAGDVSNATGTIRGATATEGSRMAHLIGTGTDTSGFLNTNGDPGTNGSLLTFIISALEGDTFTFDWNFFNTEFSDDGDGGILAASEVIFEDDFGNGFEDFAFLRIQSFTGGTDHYEVLAQIETSAVPIPAAIWLFGSALMGLVGIRRKKAIS